MTVKKCPHQWEMVDVVPGFIMLEKCFRCDRVSAYFSAEKNAPEEEYRDGDHIWNVSNIAQTIRFNLKCVPCGRVVDLRELLGVMMCTACEEACEVGKLQQRLAKKRTWVYIAFGALPTDVHPTLAPEKLEALETYFNQRRKSSGSKITMVSSAAVWDLKACILGNLSDVDLLSLKPPRETPGR